MGFLTCWMQGQAQEGDQVYSSYSSTLWNQEYVFCMLGSEMAICPLLRWENSWKSLNFIHAQIYVYVWNSKDVSCFPVILLSQLKLIFCVYFWSDLSGFTSVSLELLLHVSAYMLHAYMDVRTWVNTRTVLSVMSMFRSQLATLQRFRKGDVLIFVHPEAVSNYSTYVSAVFLAFFCNYTQYYLESL